MEPLPQFLPDLALEAVDAQRRLDADWAWQVGELHRRLTDSGLNASPLGQALEVRLRPPHPFVSTFGITLESNLVHTTTRKGGWELQPVNAGYRAAFADREQAHFHIELEIRQNPATPPSNHLPDTVTP